MTHSEKPKAHKYQKPPLPKRNRWFTVDIVVGLLTFLFPLGWSISGFPPNIVIACAIWTITIVLFLHAFWVYEHTARLPRSARLACTLAILAAVILTAWHPVLAEYRREHPPTNFAFITPGVVLYGPQKVGWDFLVHRRGLDTLFNVEIYFRDMDLVNSWSGRKSLNDDEVRASQLFVKYPEIDPGSGIGFGRDFQWAPYNLEHSHFWTRISFRGGRIDEEFRIEKTATGWQYRIKVWETDSKQVLIDCRDPSFPTDESDIRALPKCFPDITNY